MTNDEKLIEGKDFYKDEQGRVVFTTDYLIKRGYCCESGCKTALMVMVLTIMKDELPTI